jgi:hypothetical protein
MAEVFDAVDERLHRPVAVKILRRELAAEPDIRRRFEAEARNAARLTHPNVVTVFDTGEDDGLPFLVMERLPGETLADRMVGGDLDTAWILRVAGDVLLALGAAHDAGIVHRDVKPGNILLASDGCAKVADFGIAKSAEVSSAADLTRTNQMLGTPAYVAPERVVGEPATPMTDLYALGVVLYEAFTGTKPFTGNTPVAVAYAIRHTDPTPLGERRPDLDPAVAAAVDRAMAKAPADRFPTAAAMAAALGVGGPLEVRGNTDETMLALPADATAVLPASAAAVPISALVPGDETGPAPVVDSVDAPPSARRRQLIGLLILAAVLGLGLLVIAMASHGRSGGDSRIASQLRSTADHLDPSKDGPATDQAAAQLRAVAGAVDAGSGGPAATMALAQLAGWRDSHQLTPSAVDQVSSALQKVPGVDASVFTSTPSTTAAPPTTAAPAATTGDHRKHGKKGD